MLQLPQATKLFLLVSAALGTAARPALPFGMVSVRLASTLMPGSPVQAPAAGRQPCGYLVPVLVDGDTAIWDSRLWRLPNTWPRPTRQTAVAPGQGRTRPRALQRTAGMHCGFAALHPPLRHEHRGAAARVGAILWRDQAGVRADVQRLVDMGRAAGAAWRAHAVLASSRLPMPCAPVCMRLATYALPVPQPSPTMCGACSNCPASGLDRRRAGRAGLPGLRGTLPYPPRLTAHRP